MTTDYELLKLAANAAGEPYTEPFESGVLLANGEFWDPLNDDGDAFRLAVKLNICVDQKHNGVEAWNFEHRISSGLINGDPYAATRRAIVRAAARIGNTGEQL